jgi:hypothetical protein
MFMVKKFVIWPFAPVFAVAYIYRQNFWFMLLNKKFFDMCNVGEQYELGNIILYNCLGRARNEVLKKCNALLDTEDF